MLGGGELVGEPWSSDKRSCSWVSGSVGMGWVGGMDIRGVEARDGALTPMDEEGGGFGI